MTFLVYGAGVIGSIFAARLARAGHDVTVLARNERYAQIAQSGIVLKHPKARAPETARVGVISRLAPDRVFDYVLVVMQRTQVHAVLESLRDNKSPNIVFCVNTAAGYDEWTRAVGPDRLMLGFPAAGGERRDGVVHYFIGKGYMRIFQTTTFGEPNGMSTPRVRRLIRAFRGAGIPSVFCGNMDAWQKTHVAVVTCIANALYGYGCDNKRLSRAPEGVKTMLLAIAEGFRALRKLGIRPTPFKLSFFYLPSGLLRIVFQLFMKTRVAEITMAKHCIAARQEMISLQRELDQLLTKARTDTPHIDSLRKNLLP